MGSSFDAHWCCRDCCSCRVASTAHVLPPHPTHPPPQLLQDGLKRLNVPYSYGWSIVVMTAAIKLATFPLTKKQVGEGVRG